MINEENKNNIENFDNKNHVQNKRNQRNKTIKAPRKNSNKNVKSMIEMLHTTNDDENSLSDFNPPPKPISMGNENRAEKECNSDECLTHENFTALAEGTYAQQYYNQYPPAYSNEGRAFNTPSAQGKNELLEKLNYMIHLLEEQHDEKVNNITEEIVLYSFLGVFVIFIIDSFVKVGKYIR